MKAEPMAEIKALTYTVPLVCVFLTYIMHDRGHTVVVIEERLRSLAVGLKIIATVM